jgi:hypothetical protein
MSLTCVKMSALAPSIVNDTASVMIIATVMVTFRHRPTITSDRTYLPRIGGFPPESPLGWSRLAGG